MEGLVAKIKTLAGRDLGQAHGLWLEVQLNRRLQLAGVPDVPAVPLGQLAQLVPDEVPVGERRDLDSARRRLDRRRLDQPVVAAMAVDDDQVAEAVSRNAAGDIDDHGQQRLRREGQGSRERHPVG
jgi:hypothetical protein